MIALRPMRLADLGAVMELEEELFWTLVTIYRVPGVLFELTRKTRTHRIDR